MYFVWLLFLLPQKSDPFPGPAPIPQDKVQKFIRKGKTKQVTMVYHFW